jgi:hypothetical protein
MAMNQPQLKVFSLSIGEQCGQEMARKNLLDIVTMEMKNKEARNASETHIYQERRRKEKCESMLLEISISFNRLTPETWRSRYRHPLYDCRSFVL